MTVQESNKELKLIVAPGRVYEILLDSFSREIVAFEILSDISQLKIVSGNFNTVETFCLSDVFTLVPSALYQTSELENYLKYSSSENLERFKVFSNVVYTEKIEIAWGIEYDTVDKLVAKYKGAKLNSFISGVLNAIKLSPKENKIVSVFLSNQLFIVLILGGEIHLVNKFEITSIEDALYYHLLLLQRSQLDGENITLQTGGAYKEMIEFINRIEDYFNVVERHINTEQGVSVQKKGVEELLKVLGI